MEADPQDPDNSALSVGSHCRWRPFRPQHRPKRERRTSTRVYGYAERICPRRRNHGNSNDTRPPPFPAVHTRQCDAKSAARRRCLEYSRPGKSSSGIHDRFTLEEPIGVHQRAKRDQCFSLSQGAKERDYRLIKEMRAFTGNRIAVRFAYEWHDDSDHWYRSYGNENWEFSDAGLMASRFASINDIPILASDRKFYWPLGRRPDEHPGLYDLGL